MCLFNWYKWKYNKKALIKQNDVSIQTATKLYNIDYEQVRIDLAMLKSALQKGSQSFNDPSEFGIDSISSVRVLFSNLLKLGEDLI